LWQNRQSKQDIIGLETDLPIRYKLNDVGTRNIELMLKSRFGLYYKTIALIEDTNILFPREFDELTNKIDFQNFKKFGMKSEINVMIGAFSMDSLLLAIQNEDVEEYNSNGGTYEMYKAFDGTMQTFVKQKDGNLSIFSPFSNLYQSDLDGEAISAFRLQDANQDILGTTNSNSWLQRLIPQRLLEIYTIENKARQYINEFYIDNNRLEIVLSIEEETSKPRIEMNYLKEGLSQTINSIELDEDLNILIPKEVGEDFFGENPIIPIMLTQLKIIIDKHISQHNNLLKNDLITYVAECILIIEAYTNQILKKSFETEKKETFQTLYNFYYNQLPEKWKI
jgi:hypothetical protein